MRTSTAAAAAAILVALAGCSAPTAGAPAPGAAAAASPTKSPYPSQRVKFINHCLISKITVDGVKWAAIAPRYPPSGYPSPNGSYQQPTYTEGVWTQTGPASAQFVIDDPAEKPDPDPVEFRPTNEPEHPCL